MRVGLFVTCLVDLFRPSVGFAAVDLIERAGFSVEVPPAQTCCGQPAYNSGDRKDTREIAEQVIQVFEDFDYVVAPSGSCASMLKKHYPPLFADDPEWADRSYKFAAKTYELVDFLYKFGGDLDVSSNISENVTYHDSCAGLRELSIEKQPRELLKFIKGLSLTEMKDADVCCGFGGTFCVKYSDISNAIVSKKIANIEASGADMLLAGDLGCLMNMAGKLSRNGSKIQVRHVAEVLAGDLDQPAIAKAKDPR